MASTFFALLALADLNSIGSVNTNKIAGKVNPEKPSEQVEEIQKEVTVARSSLKAPGLHYNIQIHLPATKDIEVYNAIFKSLKEHLFEA